jgi:hypothetical protein
MLWREEEGVRGAIRSQVLKDKVEEEGRGE